MAVAPRGKPLVLVVEDDPGIVSLFSFILRDLGGEVEATDDAGRALEWVRDRVYALAVLDFQVRNGTGLDVARALRARDAAVPILMASGSWTPELREEASRIAGVIVMDKPVDVQRFRDAVAALLGCAS